MFWLAMFVLAVIFFVRQTFIIVPERENVIKERFGKFDKLLTNSV